jgi:hypothetical protein
MKLVRTTKTKLLFDLGRREERLFREVLKLYPRVPSAHHVLTKSQQFPARAADQRLLDEALEEQRAEHKQQVTALLADLRRLTPTETGSRLSLSHAELEWLLQVLNDIRVGSWIILGSPEEKVPELNEATAPHFWAMELAGHFQSQLLEAMGGGA